jgi:hypothetical protein
VDIVRTLKDINVNVVSAEIDTIGQIARDELFVTYEGEPLDGPMTQLVTNALQARGGRPAGRCCAFSRRRVAFGASGAALAPLAGARPAARGPCRTAASNAELPGRRSLAPTDRPLLSLLPHHLAATAVLHLPGGGGPRGVVLKG